MKQEFSEVKSLGLNIKMVKKLKSLERHLILNKFVVKLLTISILFSLLNVIGCKNEEIDINLRDKHLEKAYLKIQSNEQDEIIEGIQTIAKYPTHGGVRELIKLWKRDLSPKVENEILIALRQDEEFRKDSEFLEGIFIEVYRPKMSQKERGKLKRLIKASNAENKNELLSKMADK